MYEHRRYGDSSPFVVVDIRVTRTQDVLWLDLALIALASTGVLAIAKGLQEFFRYVLYSTLLPRKRYVPKTNKYVKIDIENTSIITAFVTMC